MSITSAIFISMSLYMNVKQGSTRRDDGLRKFAHTHTRLRGPAQAR